MSGILARFGLKQGQFIRSAAPAWPPIVWARDPDPFGSPFAVFRRQPPTKAHSVSFLPTSPPLARALAERNYNEPTPVQAAVLEDAAGRDSGLRPDRLGQDRRLRHGDGRRTATRPAARPPAAAAGADDRADARTGAAGQPRTELALRAGRRADRDLRRRHGSAPEERRALAAGRPYRRRHAGAPARPSRTRRARSVGA